MRRTVRALASVRTATEALASGDLTVVPQVHDRDELGEVATSLASAMGSLRGVMASVVGSADRVAAAVASRAHLSREDSPDGWPQPWGDAKNPEVWRTNGRPIAQWSRLRAGRSDDLTVGT